MARFIVMDEVEIDRGGEIFSEEFDTLEEAVKFADREWDRLTDHDKKRRDGFYILELANPDEDAENHFDGDVVKDYLA